MDWMLPILGDFAAEVTRKAQALVGGEPEEQLRAPLEGLLSSGGQCLGLIVVPVGEAHLADRIGTPDYAIVVDGLLCGYAELKAPGKGARPERFTGHDRQQWERFKALPNLLYLDGNEWALYRQGERVGSLVTLTGDVRRDGPRAGDAANGDSLGLLFQDFLRWEPLVPRSPRQLAELVAPLCRLLRDEVTEALKAPDGALARLASEWREYLFPGADDRQFADAYAQTVTYALLLARTTGAPALDIHQAVVGLRAQHTLLSRALEVLTDDLAQAEVPVSLALLQRVIDRVEPAALEEQAGVQPWLYFYENFLEVYDPDLRRDAGVYYTPVQVVRAQVRLIDQILTGSLGKSLGFADESVATLDPAVGTGTYVLGVIEHALSRVAAAEGEGAIPTRASHLAENLHGFEIMVGPYAVAELRITQELEARGATLPSDGPHVYLTDTLESPTATPRVAPLFYEPIAREHGRALRVKESVPVLVCLGNPPYDRHAANHDLTGASAGGWVRHGGAGESPILDAFTDPVREAGGGIHLKNLYNLYVYFWRWGLWKVFEHPTAPGPGVVSFITAASYLEGPAFAGMREHMRRLCDEIWIVDLGGEGRGTRRSENVFAIQTPVAIAVAVRYGAPRPQEPASVHYARIEGTREEKLQVLDAIHAFADFEWHDCPEGWSDHFRPRGTGPYFDWPLLSDVFPWQVSGAQIKRSWPIAPDQATLERRWTGLLASEDRATAFHETRDRKVGGSYGPLPGGAPGRAAPIARLAREEPPPPLARYAYRSFDRQYVIRDSRVGDYMRLVLWSVQGPAQMYLTTLLTHPLGTGPALTVCAEVPDLHHFRGSFGGKDCMPLWRDKAGSTANLVPGLVERLEETYENAVSPEDLLCYCYGVLASTAYTERFQDELETPGPRVPLTVDWSLFVRARDLGRRLIWLQTYAERLCPPGEIPGRVPSGIARCTRPVSNHPDQYPDEFSFDAETQVLNVGQGSFAPVSSAVWEYQVSGLAVVDSWLGYRMRRRRGRRSSSLDDIHPERWTAPFTTELLQLLWILEATIGLQMSQADLLEEIIAAPLFAGDELPGPSEESRLAPGAIAEGQLPGIG